jgi:hypothetical protein
VLLAWGDRGEQQPLKELGLYERRGRDRPNRSWDWSGNVCRDKDVALAKQPAKSCFSGDLRLF